MSEGRKPQVRVFLSFARLDEEVAQRLWERLTAATAVNRVYEFDLWRFDRALLVGDDWNACIRNALAACDLGMLALSDAFLGGEYIKDVQLPALGGRARQAPSALGTPADQPVRRHARAGTQTDL